ncbi:UDP-glucuronosyltransferase 2B1 [Cryptotermes secundus]|uniref:UDP-glucuronosyltransferase n=2 Tax=Cryptotermes secundus TaxID=105785 RepID=A0A2J7R4S8_9NEOP|nr:UDP-glucuronosyltransferase 2B37 [Cryptotermes secundus]PNF35836.1 UDP-glucuronosyltransferase 2B1 [Cryptotermes secundus]
MNYRVLGFVILTSWCASLVSGARILALFPYIGKSHFDVFEPFVKELATRGHHVVVLSHFPQKQPIPNYTDISLVGSITIHATDRIDLQNMSGIRLFKTMIKEFSNFFVTCDQMLSFHNVQELLNSQVNFDLIITETFLTDCFLPFVHKFKAPHVAMSSCIMFPWSNDRMGNPDNPSYIPTHGTWFSDKMNFSERFFNAIANIAFKFLFHATERIVTQSYIRKHFGDDVPLLSDISKNTDLLLVNSHFSLNRPRPLVPGIVEVGGLHIKPPKKLPKDLEDYLNEAEHGVIYFSMGSMIRAETLPSEKRDAFLQAFSELPQRVLWKWESDAMPGQPNNVKIAKWLPQFDILNHPNVRVFVSHGGLLGTIETVYAGVPMVGIPMFADQPMNIKAIVDFKMGVSINYKDISKENILKAVRTVLDEPSYRENAKHLSRIYMDRPMSAMDTAIFWTEYVIRHKGAAHLRPAILHLAWYQYLLLDVLAVILLFVITVFLLFYIITRKLIKKFTAKPQKKSKQS